MKIFFHEYVVAKETLERIKEPKLTIFIVQKDTYFFQKWKPQTVDIPLRMLLITKINQNSTFTCLVVK